MALTSRTPLLRRLLVLAAFAFFSPLSQGQDYPSRSVTILVAYAPGGQGDLFARMVAEKLTSQLRQTFVVDNRPGVSGTVGTKMAVQARRDGYTLFLGQTGEIVVNRVLMKDLGYDPLKDFVPIVMIGNSPLIMLAPTDAPYNTVAEFIQAARARPGEFTYASVGAGTPGHLSAVALMLGARLDMIHVPYKGVGPLMADLMAGRLQAFFSSASAALPQLKGGKLKALAVTIPQRMTSLPHVPTVAESGLAGFSHSLWGGLFAPTGTPQSVIDLLNHEVNTALASPDLKTRLEGDNMAVPRNSQAEFSAFVAAEAQKFDRLAREANLKSSP